jgi:hypothetical protein
MMYEGIQGKKRVTRLSLRLTGSAQLDNHLWFEHSGRQGLLRLLRSTFGGDDVLMLKMPTNGRNCIKH